MAHLIGKLFNIRPGEWPRALLLFSMVVLTSAGATWGTSVAYAAFLKQVGVKAVPWILVSSSALSILSIAVYTAFVDRVTHARLLMVIYAGGIACILIGLVLLDSMPLVAYLILQLQFLAWGTVFNPHFITYVNSFYDTQAAKRILPVVTAGARTGAIAAGLTMPFLTANLSIQATVVIWLCAYVIVIVLVWAMPRLLKERQAAVAVAPVLPAPGAKQRVSYRDNILEGFRYTSQSTYLRWMAIGTLVLMIAMSLIEYASSGILARAYRTPQELANYIALLGGVANMVALPILLFGMSRLIARLGLGNASLIFPVGNLIVSGALVAVPSVFSASAAFLDRTAFRLTFQASIDNLLYNAVPLRIKGRARAFVGGLIVPVGSLIGGVILFLPIASTPWVVPGLIGLVAVAYLASAWFIRQRYSQALVQMLEQEDYSFLLSQEASDLTSADPATLAKLQTKLEESTNRELSIFIAQLICQVGGSRAVPILGAAARNANDPRLRSAIVDILVAADLRNGQVRELYLDLLADPEGTVRQSAFMGLEQLAEPKDKQFLAQALEMLHDPDLDVRVRAMSALGRSGNYYEFAPAVQALDELLADPNPYVQARGVRVLGEIRHPQASQQLVEYLASPDDQVRLEAAVAVEALSRSKSDAVADRPVQAMLAAGIVPLLNDPVERARQAALAVLASLGGRESHQVMLGALADPSPRVRAMAVEALSRGGRAVIPLVHPKLTSPDPQLRDMVAVILSRVNPREFGGLIVGSNITGNLLTIHRNYGYMTAVEAGQCCASLGVLQSILREQNQALTEEIFYLLTAIHNPASIKIIRDSLGSDSARARANAVEALEALTTPQVARLIAPLFEPDLPSDRVLAISREMWDMQHPTAGQVIRQLAADVDQPWIRSVAIFALGEMGASIAPKPAPPPPEEPKAKRGRCSAADLLGALADAPATKTEPPPAPPAETPSNRVAVPLTLPDIQATLEALLTDPADDVRRAAQSARQMIATGLGAGSRAGRLAGKAQEDSVLSTIEKIIFLKEVPFFQGMTIDQLKVLANVCEEAVFEKSTRIYNENDAGGILYVVVSGQVGIEQEKRAGSFARLANIEAHSYFGEMNLFDNSPRSTSAIALQDTLTLRLRREPLIALARQHPDLSLELINVLSQRLRETSDRIAELTRSRPRELHKLYDQFA